MSRFLTDLEVELVDDTSHEGRGTWRLLSALQYQSDVAGQVFTVPAGFLTDFASVPRLAIAYALVGDTAHRAAVVHDYLYSTGSSAIERGVADSVLKEAALAEGVPAWQAWLLYLGVRAGGGLFFKQKDKDEKDSSGPVDGPLA